jgi:cytochrome P450
VNRLIEANFFEISHILNPFSFYEMVWEQDTPIVRIPNTDTYVVFSARLIVEVCRRTSDFSSAFGEELIGSRAHDPDIEAISGRGWPFASTLMIADPPRHTRTRRLVMAALKKDRIDGMAPAIRSLTIDLMANFIDKGNCEFMSEFAVPFPIEVIKDQIGLGHVPVGKIKSWSDAVADRAAGQIDKDREIECARLILEFQLTMMEEIARRSTSPKDDVLQFLVDARTSEEPPLSDGEMLSMLQQLMVAGNETTTNTLGAGMLRLCENPEALHQAQQNPSTIPTLTEEMLRIDSPAQGIWRKTAHETVLGGVTIPAGAMVMCRLASANRDPRVYDDPAAFCPHRPGLNRHVAFGIGIHNCVGHYLARLELQVAFEELLACLRNIKLTDGFRAQYNYNTMVRGPAKLQISFERRKIQG